MKKKGSCFQGKRADFARDPDQQHVVCTDNSVEPEMTDKIYLDHFGAVRTPVAWEYKHR